MPRPDRSPARAGRGGARGDRRGGSDALGGSWSATSRSFRTRWPPATGCACAGCSPRTSRRSTPRSSATSGSSLDDHEVWLTRGARARAGGRVVALRGDRARGGPVAPVVAGGGHLAGPSLRGPGPVRFGRPAAHREIQGRAGGLKRTASPGCPIDPTRSQPPWPSRRTAGGRVGTSRRFLSPERHPMSRSIQLPPRRRPRRLLRHLRLSAAPRSRPRPPRKGGMESGKMAPGKMEPGAGDSGKMESGKMDVGQDGARARWPPKGTNRASDQPTGRCPGSVAAALASSRGGQTFGATRTQARAPDPGLPLAQRPDPAR